MRGLCLAILLSLATPAAANYTTAGELRDACTVAGNPESRNAFQAIRCYAFVEGYIQGHQQTTTVPLVCFGPNVTMSQLAAVYVKYADDHPNEWDKTAGEALYNALRASFPCPAKH